MCERVADDETVKLHLKQELRGCNWLKDVKRWVLIMCGFHIGMLIFTLKWNETDHIEQSQNSGLLCVYQIKAQG